MLASGGKNKRFVAVLAGVLFLLTILIFVLCGCSNDENVNDGYEPSDEDETEQFFVILYFDQNEEPVFLRDGDSAPATNKDGMYFVGWFEQGASEKTDLDALLDSKLERNHHLYAVYEPMKTFEGVTFDDKSVVWSGEPIVIEVLGAPSGAIITYDSSNVRTNVGVYEIGATVEMAGYYTLNLSATLTVEKKMCTITFKQENAQDEIRVVEYGARLLEIPTPNAKNGYDVAWDVADFANVTQDMTVNCQYTPIEYTISLHNNISGYMADTLVDSAIPFTVESATISLPTPTRDGYTFVEWNTKADFSGEAVSEIASGSVGDLTLYAKWDLVTYTITYVEDGYVPEKDYEIRFGSYTIESGLERLMIPTYTDGSVFEGWCDNQNLEGEVYLSIEIGTTGDLVLYAKTSSPNQA